MRQIELSVADIPHGHGLSFKRGIADALLSVRANEQACHPTHRASYERGYALGETLREELAARVRA